MSKEQMAINRLMCGNTAHSCKADYIQLAIKALKAVEKIASIIQIEQQPTSCEYTKLKSFEMIEAIIAEYQKNINIKE